MAEKRRNLRAFVVTLVYFIVSAILSLPWTLYADYFREKAYGRTSQPLARLPWPGRPSRSASRRLIGGLFMMGVYWLMRRTGKRWWIWSGALTAIGLFLPHPACAGAGRAPVQQIRAGAAGPGPRRGGVDHQQRAGIPANKVYMFNGSRQSNNFTADAGGVGSTGSVAISDVAFKNASLDEVRAVTGHEIGHYVLKHTWWGILLYSIAAIVLFWIADRSFPALRESVQGIGRPSPSRAGCRCCCSWSRYWGW